MTVATDRLVAEYREHGVAVLRGALGRDLVDRVRTLSLEVWERARRDPACADRIYLRSNARGERVADRIDPYLDLHPELAVLPAQPELCAPAAALLGGPSWVLKDKLILKQPGVDGYGMHQDQAYYQATGVPADRLVSVAMPLAPADRGSGPLEVATELHDRLLTGPDELDPDPATPVAGWAEVEVEPGDLLFLHPLALHRSAPNRSTAGRPVAYVTFGTGPGGDEAARLVRDHYLRGRKASIDAGGTGRLSRPSGPTPGPAPPPPRA